MRVRLTRKLAEMIDGVNLSGYNPGDLLELSDAEAQLIIAEQWGILERRGQDRVTDRPQSVALSSHQAPVSVSGAIIAKGDRSDDQAPRS